MKRKVALILFLGTVIAGGAMAVNPSLMVGGGGPPNVLPDGRFKPADVLRAEWQAILAGAPAETVVHQCGSGVSACLNVLAMEVAGMPGSRLYAGSWSEWCADPARPVAR